MRRFLLPLPRFIKDNQEKLRAFRRPDTVLGEFVGIVSFLNYGINREYLTLAKAYYRVTVTLDLTKESADLDIRRGDYLFRNKFHEDSDNFTDDDWRELFGPDAFEVENVRYIQRPELTTLIISQ